MSHRRRNHKDELRTCYHDGKQWTPVKEGMASLTAAERQIVELVGRGLSGPQISNQIRRADGTVSKHISRAMEKLNITRFNDLIRYAAEQRILKTNPGNQPNLNRVAELLEQAAVQLRSKQTYENETHTPITAGVRTGAGLLNFGTADSLQQLGNGRAHNGLRV